MMPRAKALCGQGVGTLAAVVLLAAAGCTGSGSERAAPSTSGDPGNGWPGVVAKVQPSVVTVVTADGIGSGVVFNDGGVIVTNQHVVSDAQNVQVALADGTRVTGRVAAADRGTDLAVVRVDRANLPSAKFQTKLPQAGEPVIAMGSPLGLEGSVTAGIVSGIGRQVPGSAARTRALVDLVQTDAAISPGNSGGALVNARGEIIGINEAYLPPQTGAVSIGFAVPAATVVDTVNELLRTGEAAHAYLGITPGRLSPQIAQALGVQAERGAVVMDVAAQGPAAAAGIRQGDVITQVGDRKVDTVEDLLGALRGYDPGESAGITLNRAGEPRTVQVTFGELPE